MRANVERVAAVLRERGATGEIRMLPDSARTAAAAASGLGVEVPQIANSLVFDADGEPLLVISGGGHRVDTTRLAERIGVHRIRRATPEFVRDTTGFAIGGVPPVGHARPIRTVIDTALSDWDEVWAAAGHPHSVFPTSFTELVCITGGESVDAGEHATEPH